MRQVNSAYVSKLTTAFGCSMEIMTNIIAVFFGTSFEHCARGSSDDKALGIQPKFYLHHLFFSVRMTCGKFCVHICSTLYSALAVCKTVCHILFLPQTSAPFRIFSGKRQIGKFSILNLGILFSFWQKKLDLFVI